MDNNIIHLFSQKAHFKSQKVHNDCTHHESFLVRVHGKRSDTVVPNHSHVPHFLEEELTVCSSTIKPQGPFKSSYVAVVHCADFTTVKYCSGSVLSPRGQIFEKADKLCAPTGLSRATWRWWPAFVLYRAVSLSWPSLPWVVRSYPSKTGSWKCRATPQLPNMSYQKANYSIHHQPHQSQPSNYSMISLFLLKKKKNLHKKMLKIQNIYIYIY